MNSKPTKDEPDYIHAKEFAYRHAVSHNTALRLAREGKITGAVKVGKLWRMPNNRKTQA